MDYGLSWDVPSEAVRRRRAMVAEGSPRSSWDVPSDWGTSHTAGSYGSTGNDLLDTARSAYLNDAVARVRGSRLTAMTAAPNDPSLAAFGGLSAMLGGQSDVARGLGQLGSQWAQNEDQQAWQEHMARLQAELQRKAIEEANRYAWLGQLSQLGGTLGGAYLGGIGGRGGSGDLMSYLKNG